MARLNDRINDIQKKLNAKDPKAVRRALQDAAKAALENAAEQVHKRAMFYPKKDPVRAQFDRAIEAIQNEASSLVDRQPERANFDGVKPNGRVIDVTGKKVEVETKPPLEVHGAKPSSIPVSAVVAGLVMAANV